MKAGDLLKHNGNHSLWLLLELSGGFPFEGYSILALNPKTGYKMWADPKTFEVVSKCQECPKRLAITILTGYIIDVKRAAL